MKWIQTFEGFLMEGAGSPAIPAGVEAFAQDEGAEIYLAKFDGRSIRAQSTDKKWPSDSAPVTKYFTRGGYRDVKIEGEHWIIEGDKFWYFRVGPMWYAVKRGDYSTPPFEY